MFGSVSNCSITQNVTSGGAVGLSISSSDVGNVISQNICRNCQFVGASVSTSTGTGNVPFLNNVFGECGLAGVNQVLSFNPTGSNDITVFNNIYAGHANGQSFFMTSSVHLNFVSGNTQLQTALPNNLP
jgi:hypothetical protein